MSGFVAGKSSCLWSCNSKGAIISSGSDFSPLFGTWEVSAVLCSVLASPAQERTLHSGVSPEGTPSKLGGWSTLGVNDGNLGETLFQYEGDHIFPEKHLSPWRYCTSNFISL